MQIFRALFSVLLVLLLLIQPGHAKEFSGVIVALPFSAEKDASEEEVKMGIKQLIQTIRSQPGLLEDKLLINTNHSEKKSYVHVMRWNSLNDWERMFASSNFVEALKKNSNAIHYDDAAGVYESIH
mgnify:CR=1 FL=1